ncbi:hypothetical protein GCM10010344_55680 [Streptomyces bluensis]|nr:hypothetical protein GCM10010344_55680 [Streptomyces bluensis]
MDEVRARVDECHCHVVTLRQAIGGHDAGVSPADHDDIDINICVLRVLRHGVSRLRFQGFGLKTPRDRSL